MQKTFACKYKSTCSKIRKKYVRDKIFGVDYMTTSGMKRCEFYHDGFNRQNTCSGSSDNIDVLPNYRKYSSKNSLAMRLLAGKCELCAIETADIHMHHVKSLKKLTGATVYECQMLKIRRKSLALCAKCYKGTKQ